MNQNKTMVVVGSAPLVPMGERARILAEWTESGLSAREYAKRSSVPEHRLYWWRRKLQPAPRRVVAAVPFVEVPPVASSPSGWGAEVMTRCGAVRLSAAAAPVWAAQLVRELSRC
jgi:hypothetical protein